MRNYNWLYLRGDLHITDEKYCEMTDVDLSLAHSAAVNDSYIEQNPERNKAYIEKKLAEHGLLDTGEHDEEKL